MEKKTTRRALLLSVISLLLSVSLLVGATFAWFTDSVSSDNNVIVTGNLDVELYYKVEGQSDWAVLDADTNVFMADALWEPGHTEVVKLKIVNKGTLSVKYDFGVTVATESGSENVNGDAFLLSDHIKYAVIPGEQTYTREEAVAAAGATATALNVPYEDVEVTLLPRTDTNADNEDTVTMVVYMPASAGNEVNHGKGKPVPTITLGISLFATQFTGEFDSFGNDYDANAPEIDETPTLPPVGTSAEDCTWAEISAIGAAGRADEYFDLGDTKTVTLSDGTSFAMEIVAFNADVKADGTPAAITWLSKNVITKHTMNSTITNDGGWANTGLRAWLQGDFAATLPEELREAIVAVQKTYGVNNSEKPATSDYATCEDTLWIPSIREVRLGTEDSQEDAGVKYDHYFTSKQQLKKTDLNGTSIGWWTRTSGEQQAHGQFYYLYPLLTSFIPATTDMEYGVVLGFCV